MDNELVIMIGDLALRFKLKSQAIVTLEKIYGKNIFEVFQDLSFTSMQRIFWESLQNKADVTDMNDMMDKLLSVKTLMELGNTDLQELAVKSGILKAEDISAAEKETSLEEIKNV